jgi:hypothetical protein
MMSLFLTVDTLRKREWSSLALVILMFCYPLGKVVETWQFGPDVLRWYLSDVGFVPMTSWILVKTGSIWRKRTEYRHWIIGIGIALAGAMLVEALQFTLNPYTKNLKWTARGDWVDMVCYAASALVMLAFVRVQCLNSAIYDPRLRECEAVKPERKQKQRGNSSANRKRRKHGRR